MELVSEETPARRLASCLEMLRPRGSPRARAYLFSQIPDALTHPTAEPADGPRERLRALPPPNRFDRHPARATSGPAHRSPRRHRRDDVEPIRAALASAGVREVFLRDAAPAGLGPALVVSPARGAIWRDPRIGRWHPNEDNRLVVDSPRRDAPRARRARYPLRSRLARPAHRPRGGDVPAARSKTRRIADPRRASLHPAREDIRLLPAPRLPRRAPLQRRLPRNRRRMEYARHPEITARWRASIASSWRTRAARGSREHVVRRRTTPHATLAGDRGSLRTGATRCRPRIVARHEIIPEVSRSPFLLPYDRAPEIAEAQDDTFPTRTARRTRAPTRSCSTLDEMWEVWVRPADDPYLHTSLHDAPLPALPDAVAADLFART